MVLAAPLTEEFAKAISFPLFGRMRIKTEQQAIMLGVCAGAGFAILENMLYEAPYAQWNSWVWSGMTLLRALGSVLHPLLTGIVALGWFRMKKQGGLALLKAYGLAVGLHALWNIGFQALLLINGLEYYDALSSTSQIHGQSIGILLIALLVFLSLVLWLFMRQATRDLQQDSNTEVVTFHWSPRALAFWALTAVALIISIGAALGPVWPEIKALLLGGN